MKIQITKEKFKIKYFIAYLIILFVPVSLLMQLEYVILPAWLTLFLLGYIVAVLFWFRGKDVLYASLLVFFYVFLLIAPIYQILSGEFPWGGVYSKRHIIEAWWLSFLSLLFFEIGYISIRRSAKKVKQDIVEPLLSNRGKFLLFGGAIFCTLLGLSYVGVSSLFLVRNDTSQVLSSTLTDSSLGPMIGAILRVPTVIIMLLFAYDLVYQIKRKANRKNILFSMWLIFFLFIIVAVINNPISTARFWMGSIFLSTLLLYFVLFNKENSAAWFLLNVSILVAIFPVMDLYRNSMEESVVEAIVNIDPKGELTTSPDFDAFQQQVNTIFVRETSEYSKGNQTLSSLFFFVPRSFWTSKSDPSGVYVAEMMGYNFTNLSAPLFTEFYLDGWFIGVSIGMFFLGLVYKKTQNLFTGRASALPAIFYCFFCSYQVYFLRGSLMAVIGYLFVAVLVLAAINYFKPLFYTKH